MNACLSVKKELKRYPEYENKTVLYKQKIKGKTTDPKYVISEYYKQEANKGLIFTDYKFSLQAYLLGKREKFLFFKPYNKERYLKKIDKIEARYNKRIAKHEGNPEKQEQLTYKRDKKKLKFNKKISEGNWLMTAVGEPPVFYDSTVMLQSAENIKSYLQSGGFFNAEVTPEPVTVNHKTKITYRVKENRPHLIEKVKYTIPDPTIDSILTNYIKKESAIEPGERYQANALTLEREQINRILKDNGYFRFQRQFIIFYVDTLNKDYLASIEVEITNPTEGRHERYKIDSLNFTIDATKTEPKDTIYKDGIVYIHGKSKYSKKILGRDIKFREGDYYSLSKTQLTQTLLGSKDIFKFINISYQEIDSAKLNVYLNANTLKKYQLTTEVGANVNVSQGQGLPGPFFNVSFKRRRLFSGFEILEANLRYSYEQQPTIQENDQSLRAIEAGGNLNLIFPVILLPTKFRFKFNDYTPKTIISTGYRYTERYEYTRTNTELSLNYRWNPNRFQIWSVSPFGLNVVNLQRIDAEFEDYLNRLQLQGNNLKTSFQSSIISSMSTSYVFNNNDITKNVKAKYYRLFLEIGGLFYGAFEDSKALIEEQATGKLLGLPYYQFAKFSIDHRRYFPITKTSTLVGRLNAGVATPFGYSSVLPYEKYFFTGGLNSIRAWPLKRLGPGEFVRYNNDGSVDYSFEQPGEILIEANLELRAKLIGFLHGAVFLDAGNVWTLKADNARPGSEFYFSKFYQQIAVGTGTGLRFNFSFLIIRFDMGMKLWDPGRKIMVPFNDKTKFVYNFGIGYPF